MVLFTSFIKTASGKYCFDTILLHDSSQLFSNKSKNFKNNVKIIFFRDLIDYFLLNNNQNYNKEKKKILITLSNIEKELKNNSTNYIVAASEYFYIDTITSLKPLMPNAPVLSGFSSNLISCLNRFKKETSSSSLAKCAPKQKCTPPPKLV